MQKHKKLLFTLAMLGMSVSSALAMNFRQNDSRHIPENQQQLNQLTQSEAQHSVTEKRKINKEAQAAVMQSMMLAGVQPTNLLQSAYSPVPILKNIADQVFTTKAKPTNAQAAGAKVYLNKTVNECEQIATEYIDTVTNPEQNDTQQNYLSFQKIKDKIVAIEQMDSTKKAKIDKPDMMQFMASLVAIEQRMLQAALAALKKMLIEDVKERPFYTATNGAKLQLRVGLALRQMISTTTGYCRWPASLADSQTDTKESGRAAYLQFREQIYEALYINKNSISVARELSKQEIIQALKHIQTILPKQAEGEDMPPLPQGLYSAQLKVINEVFELGIPEKDEVLQSKWVEAEDF